MRSLLFFFFLTMQLYERMLQMQSLNTFNKKNPKPTTPLQAIKYKGKNKDTALCLEGPVGWTQWDGR